MSVCSVMIVDDCEDDRYVLKRLLKKTKLKTKIFEAENGQVALDFITNVEDNSKKYPKTFPPMMIFLDINMPIMNGFEFLDKFDEHKMMNEDFDSIVFAMFSSSERKEDLEKAKSYNFVKGFVSKGTVTVDSLTKSIKEAFPQVAFVE